MNGVERGSCVAALEIGGADLGVGQKLAAGAAQPHAAVGQHVAAVGELQRLEGVLLDQEDRDALARALIWPIASKICCTRNGARPSDGSSSSSSRGRPSARGRSPASAARRPTACRRAGRAAPSAAGTGRRPARGPARNAPDRRAMAPICRFSSTSCAGRCGGPPAPGRRRAGRSRRSADAVMSWPSSMIAPVRACGLPQIVISSVDLPAPLAPMRVTISPCGHVEVDARAAPGCCRRRSRTSSDQHQHAPRRRIGATRAAARPRRLAEIGADHGRIAADLGRRAVGDLAAIVEHDDVVGDAHDHAHVVLDQQHADAVAVADRDQQLGELGRFARVEAGRRLVEAEQRGSVHMARAISSRRWSP